MLPFQPSPHESVADRVQTVFAGTVDSAEYGAPPESVVPSEQESVQLTSVGNEPPPTVTVDVTGAPAGGATTGDGGGAAGDGGMKAETVNVCVAEEPDDNVNVVPRPIHVAPFQPSPHESIADRVHIVPIDVASAPENGLPPESVMPSEQESVQLTSVGNEPPLTVIGNAGGGGGAAGDGGMTTKLNVPEEPPAMV